MVPKPLIGSQVPKKGKRANIRNSEEVENPAVDIVGGSGYS